MYDDYNRRIYEMVEPGKRVLDVGCATGKLLERLGAEKRCKTFGIEMDPALAEQARPRCQELFVGNIETMDLAFSKEAFEVVVIADVLEHLRDPAAVLRKVREYLKKDGSLLLSIPNIAFLTARLNLLLGRFDYADYGIMDRTHLRFFTLSTARRLVTENGFRIVTLEGYNQVRDRYRLLRPLGRMWKTLWATDFVIRAVRDE